MSEFWSLMGYQALGYLPIFIAIIGLLIGLHYYFSEDNQEMLELIKKQKERKKKQKSQ